MTTIIIALAFFAAGYIWGRFPGVGSKVTAGLVAAGAWVAQQWDAIAPMLGLGN